MDMNVKQYQQAVIDLFKSGKASDDCWEEMAEAVLGVSETSGCEYIDAEIYGQVESTS